jgi:hypothetical protein
MPFTAPAFVQVHPSHFVPEILLPYQQASGAFDLLAERDPTVQLGDGDLAVYIKSLDIRTKTAAGNSPYNSLPGVSIEANQISTPTYLLRARAEYDHHETRSAGVWGVSLPEAYRLGTRQAFFQQMRNALLYGFNPLNGEGMLNTVGATTTTLPADSFGNTTISTYDNGQMALFLLGLISSLMTRTMQVGQKLRIAALMPQRVFTAWNYQGVVQLTQFQREGAGVATTGDMTKLILAGQGLDLEFCCDDTLIGQGAGGTDAILFTIPEVKKPGVNPVNTNEFAKVTPGLSACNLQYCDMDAPREIISPLAGGATDVLSELRITSGWTVRPEALTILSAAY